MKGRVTMTDFSKTMALKIPYCLLIKGVRCLTSLSDWCHSWQDGSSWMCDLLPMKATERPSDPRTSANLQPLMMTVSTGEEWHNTNTWLLYLSRFFRFMYCGISFFWICSFTPHICTEMCIFSTHIEKTCFSTFVVKIDSKIQSLLK